MKRFLVIDDLATSLVTYPILVPLPAKLAQRPTEPALRAFIMKTLREVMQLRCFDWYHAFGDVVLDGFTVRNDKIYPSFST